MVAWAFARLSDADVVAEACAVAAPQAPDTMLDFILFFRVGGSFLFSQKDLATVVRMPDA